MTEDEASTDWFLQTFGPLAVERVCVCDRTHAGAFAAVHTMACGIEVLAFGARASEAICALAAILPAKAREVAA
ncbi:MAG: hypothetical protein Q8S13_13340 [Dehalococcoidia bacterium]|nr:hypothetical protein [Dehalococcoidia bacterium]